MDKQCKHQINLRVNTWVDETGKLIYNKLDGKDVCWDDNDNVKKRKLNRLKDVIRERFAGVSLCDFSRYAYDAQAYNTCMWNTMWVNDRMDHEHQLASALSLFFGCPDSLGMLLIWKPLKVLGLGAPMVYDILCTPQAAAVVYCDKLRSPLVNMLKLTAFFNDQYMMRCILAHQQHLFSCTAANTGSISHDNIPDEPCEYFKLTDNRNIQQKLSIATDSSLWYASYVHSLTQVMLLGSFSLDTLRSNGVINNMEFAQSVNLLGFMLGRGIVHFENPTKSNNYGVQTYTISQTINDARTRKAEVVRQLNSMTARSGEQPIVSPYTPYNSSQDIQANKVLQDSMHGAEGYSSNTIDNMTHLHVNYITLAALCLPEQALLNIVGLLAELAKRNILDKSLASHSFMVSTEPIAMTAIACTPEVSSHAYVLKVNTETLLNAKIKLCAVEDSSMWSIDETLHTLHALGDLLAKSDMQHHVFTKFICTTQIKDGGELADEASRRLQMDRFKNKLERAEYKAARGELSQEELYNARREYAEMHDHEAYLKFIMHKMSTTQNADSP